MNVQDIRVSTHKHGHSTYITVEVEDDDYDVTLELVEGLFRDKVRIWHVGYSGSKRWASMLTLRGSRTFMPMPGIARWFGRIPISGRS